MLFNYSIRMIANFYKQVYQVVRCIPPGKVTSYGRIAGMLGRSNAARAVGYALNALRQSGIEDFYTPDTVPWHRVINRQGKISTRHHGSSEERQAEKLRAEGVAVSNDLRVDMNLFLWKRLDVEEVEKILKDI